MRIDVKLFAILRERAGTGEVSIDLADGARCSDALSAVAARFPELAPMLARAACAVDQEYVALHTALRDGQELALIPPVSGG